MPPEQEFPILEQNKSFPQAIIVDIDGTVANRGTRHPHNYDDVFLDTPYTEVIDIITELSKVYEIIFVSGRKERSRVDTIRWLEKYTKLDNKYLLLMRVDADNRKDDIVKYEIAQSIIKGYYIKAVFDDRDRVVSMWRQAGIRCFQCQYGNF